MSVYTPVEPAQLEQFLERYQLGQAQALVPITAGITNTNFYLDTEVGHFVLTLYEQNGNQELDYILGLQQYLAERDIFCPAPVRDRHGAYYSTLNQRPAAINKCLPGQVVTSPSISQCESIAAELARFHLLGRDFPGSRPNPRGIDWLLLVRDKLDSGLSQTDRQLIATTLQDYQNFDHSNLPAGAIHADLFHDNALFRQAELGGIIDFDYACNDSFVFDIAVVMNDWCIDQQGELDPVRVRALLDAYQRQRHLDLHEIQSLPIMLRITALRFWLSRLHDKTFPQSGELTFFKSPDLFRQLLIRRSDASTELEPLFLPHLMR